MPLCPFLYAGRRYDAETGLYYVRARYYDPDLGRFLSRDPLGYAAGANLYLYAGGNPAAYTDPDGEFAFLILAGIIIAGALIAGAFDAARQGVQIWEGSRTDFDWGELGTSMLLGGALAPAFALAPEVMVPLMTTFGLASAGNQYVQGNTATAAFDLGTSLLPFAFKGVRSSVFGERSFWAPRPAGTGRLAFAGSVVGERYQAINAQEALVRELGSRAWAVGKQIEWSGIPRATYEGWARESRRRTGSGLIRLFFGLEIEIPLRDLTYTTRSGNVLSRPQQNIRFAPVGNRTGNPYGRYPHYHYARPWSASLRTAIEQNKNDNNQGLRWHRPIEKNDPSGSWIDRFF